MGDQVLGFDEWKSSWVVEVDDVVVTDDRLFECHIEQKEIEDVRDVWAPAELRA